MLNEKQHSKNSNWLFHSGKLKLIHVNNLDFDIFNKAKIDSCQQSRVCDRLAALVPVSSTFLKNIPRFLFNSNSLMSERGGHIRRAAILNE